MTKKSKILNLKEVLKEVQLSKRDVYVAQILFKDESLTMSQWQKKLSENFVIK